IIPHTAGLGRALAPDLIGMGRSSRAPGGSYRFADHARYLDAWFEAAEVGERVVIVGHDWGGALGFHWARRNADRVQGIVYMETIVRPLAWSEWPEKARGIFAAMRSAAGEDLVLQKNVFVERILPASVLRGLGEAEMAVYRAPYGEPGESRRPTLVWPRDIPLDGQPAEVAALVKAYSEWLARCPVAKLFVNAKPGSILTGAQRDDCRRWPHQREVTVKGSHFIQEDSPHEIGAAIAAFVRKLRGGA
ncbi:MAG: haloalkane dehalogenase, partial [Alphaproteobacteria bacterium]